jgi:hypothetical protein
MPKFSSEEISDTAAPDHHLSRREFAKRAAVAATTAVVLPASLLSQEAAAKPASSADQTPQSANPLSPELQAEGELKYQWIIQTYGKRLSEEQKQDLHRLVMEGQKPLAAFRAFPLENADQPATVLKLTGVELSEGSRD